MHVTSAHLIWNLLLRFQWWLAGALLATAPQLLHAQPSVPWMPSAAVRSDIEWLVDEAGLDLIVTQWPLPRAAVVHALDKLPAHLDPALQFARERVETALAKDLGSQATLTLQGHADELVGFGDDSTPGTSLAVRSSTLQTDHVAIRAGIRFDSVSGLNEKPKLRFDDSALVTGALGIQLQAFSHRYWWGPGWQSSLTLGNNTPAFNGVGIQRASGSRSDSPWLAWLGPWNYDMFIAQTEDVSDPANPYFFGQRLTFRPFSNLEIGLTRTAQWGGRGRQQTFKSFLNMLTGKGVNADTTAQQADDPANEEAGFDFRLKCPLGLRCAAYTQLTGEDQAGVLPSRYLGLYGLESWSSDGNQRYYVEWAEVACSSPVGRPFLRYCAYRNYAYPQGYTNAGRWIGSSVGPRLTPLHLRLGRRAARQFGARRRGLGGLADRHLQSVRKRSAELRPPLRHFGQAGLLLGRGGHHAANRLAAHRRAGRRQDTGAYRRHAGHGSGRRLPKRQQHARHVLVRSGSRQPAPAAHRCRAGRGGGTPRPVRRWIRPAPCAEPFRTCARAHRQCGAHRGLRRCWFVVGPAAGVRARRPRLVGTGSRHLRRRYHRSGQVRDRPGCAWRGRRGPFTSAGVDRKRPFPPPTPRWLGRS